ncbi:putative nucleotidyltransferase, ribonuclease H [Tanacetum coccineum]
MRRFLSASPVYIKSLFLGQNCICRWSNIWNHRRLKLSPMAETYYGDGTDEKGSDIDHPSDSGGFPDIQMMQRKKGLGCVLMQHGKDCSYSSRQLKPYEVNYKPMNLSYCLVFCPLKIRDTICMVKLSKKLKGKTVNCGLLCKNVEDEQALREKDMTEPHKFSHLLFIQFQQNVQRFETELLVDPKLRLVFGKDYKKSWGTSLQVHTAFLLKQIVSQRGPIRLWKIMLRACIWNGHVLDEYYCLSFKFGDRVFLKVSPFQRVKRFGTRQLSPRFNGPLEILEANIQPDMSLSEEPESILDRQERVMRNKVIPFVKILWKNHPEREATWETEESMRASYPHFFV